MQPSSKATLQHIPNSYDAYKDHLTRLVKKFDNIYLYKAKEIINALNISNDVTEDIDYQVAHVFKVLNFVSDEQECKTLYTVLDNISKIYDKVINNQHTGKEQELKDSLSIQLTCLSNALIPYNHQSPKATYETLYEHSNKYSRECHETLFGGKLYLKPVHKTKIKDSKPVQSSNSAPTSAKSDSEYESLLKKYYRKTVYVSHEFIQDLFSDPEMVQPDRQFTAKIDSCVVPLPAQVLTDIRRTDWIIVNGEDAVDITRRIRFQTPQEESIFCYELCAKLLGQSESVETRETILRLFHQSLLYPSQLYLSTDYDSVYSDNRTLESRYSLQNLKYGIICKNIQDQDWTEVVGKQEVKVIKSSRKKEKGTQVNVDEVLGYVKATIVLHLKKDELASAQAKNSYGYVYFSPCFKTLNELRNYDEIGGSFDRLRSWLRG